jgi:hypothetical protein
MPETRVVNIKSGEPFDVYIGRFHRTPRYGLMPRSKWHNPDKAARSKPVEQARAEYRAHVLSRPDLVAALCELKGKRIGCWCAPEFCHGQVLVELVREFCGGETDERR